MQGKGDITKLLVEAHSTELAQITTLQAHIPMAAAPSYRHLLESHMRETREHANRIQRRLSDLGYSRNLLAAGFAAAQNVVKQGLVLTKGPIDAIRSGPDLNEKMLRNARDEIMTEGFEIAAYDTLESVARGFGDHETAELAADIRLDEERMLEALRKEIPILAAEFVTDHAPGTTGATTEPWPGYDDMTAEEIDGRLREASRSETAAVAAYESKNKGRTTVLAATERETADA